MKNEQKKNTSPEANAKKWTEEKVHKAIDQDINATISFLEMLRNNQKLNQLLKEVVWDDIDKDQTEREKQEEIPFDDSDMFKAETM